MRKFCERHKNDRNIIDMNLWDAGMTHFIKLESLFFSKCRDQFFTASCNLEEVDTYVSPGKD